MDILNKNYYKKYSTSKLAKNLLGKIIYHQTKEGLVSGKIVETEAYLYNDSAAHTFIGMTNRNKSAFEEAGTSYVYFIYGSYYCFNVASNIQGIGEAVLIRALEPIDGINIMKERLIQRHKKSLDLLNTISEK